jgi:thiol-disulfide isomerase/thioredoxin
MNQKDKTHVMLFEKKRTLIFWGLFILFFSCNENPKGTQVSINILGASGKKIFLYRQPFINESSLKIDSAVIVNYNHPTLFKIPPGEERLYMLRVENSSGGYSFINDVASIQIKANDINGKYSIDFSPASLSWKKFTDSQVVIAKKLRSITADIKNLNNKLQVDSLKKYYDVEYARFLTGYINYADTVQSPAAFMAAYENIDFGNRYNELKNFVDKAIMQHPNYKPIADLKKEIYDMVSIFEEEFNIGDSLPFVNLPDTNGRFFSTGSLKGKYYLIDFWATWCPRCLAYNKYKKAVWDVYNGRNFQMVSVALDDEKENWLNVVNKDGMVWSQLIDENMWRGTAAKTLKFDSIPFNFFVDPEGVIIAKAIKPDSLQPIIAKYLK